jgi:hypothetical protein
VIHFLHLGVTEPISGATANKASCPGGPSLPPGQGTTGNRGMPVGTIIGAERLEADT